MESAPIKMLACGRRKPGMTRSEYLAYHFKVHGEIADRPTDLSEKPAKYIQVHITDAAFPQRSGSHVPNANYVWWGRDDITELTYKDMAHIKSVFGSPYVQRNVGPDALNFADVETTISVLTTEQTVSLPFEVKSGAPEETALVAHLWLASTTGGRDGAQLERVVSPVLASALSEHASDDVYELRANISFTSSEFDLEKYFGGNGIVPTYCLVYKVFLHSQSSIAAFRKAQQAFESAVASIAADDGSKVDSTKTFLSIGRSGLVLNAMGENIPFDAKRIPQTSYLE